MGAASRGVPAWRGGSLGSLFASGMGRVGRLSWNRTTRRREQGPNDSSSDMTTSLIRGLARRPIAPAGKETVLSETLREEREDPGGLLPRPPAGQGPSRKAGVQEAPPTPGPERRPGLAGQKFLRPGPWAPGRPLPPGAAPRGGIAGPTADREEPP
jgi:hypothetical protein